MLNLHSIHNVLVHGFINLNTKFLPNDFMIIGHMYIYRAQLKFQIVRNHVDKDLKVNFEKKKL